MKFCIENHINQIPIALGKIHSFTTSYVPVQEDLHFLKIVLDEALSNIIKYAYPNNETKLIELETKLENNQIIIQITDDGRPFNPLTEFNFKPISNPKNPDEGGMGIHLMKNLVDRLEYQFVANKNVLIIKKTITKV
jgi:anti-sigma regulatory factor (Ser/Thr protein kinase)